MRIRARVLAALRDVLCRWAFLPFDNVEFYSIPLRERLEAIPSNRAVVDEAILLSIVRGDKAKALRIVEPLYLAGRTHFLLLVMNVRHGRITAAGTSRWRFILPNSPNETRQHSVSADRKARVAGGHYITVARLGQ